MEGKPRSGSEADRGIGLTGIDLTDIELTGAELIGFELIGIGSTGIGSTDIGSAAREASPSVGWARSIGGGTGSTETADSSTPAPGAGTSGSESVGGWSGGGCGERVGMGSRRPVASVKACCHCASAMLM